MAKDKNKETEKSKNVMKQLELTEEQASQVRGGEEGDPDMPIVIGRIPAAQLKALRGKK